MPAVFRVAGEVLVSADEGWFCIVDPGWFCMVEPEELGIVVEPELGMLDPEFCVVEPGV